MAAAAAAKADTTNSADGIQIYTVGFGLDGTNNTDPSNLCTESGTWSGKTPRSALVAIASPGAADNPCTAPPTGSTNYSSENTPIYYNPSSKAYVYLSATPLSYLNPTSMTQVTTAPRTPWEPVPDHFFCVPKSSGQPSAGLTTMLAQAASDLAAGAHLVQLPQPPPIITSINVNTGSVKGGTVVTLTGHYFTGVYAANFGTTAATFSVGSDTAMTVTSPAGSAGSVNITVVNPAGTSNGVGFTYTSP